MSNRTITALTSIVIVGIGVLFLLKYTPPLAVNLDVGYLSPNQVRGSATEKNGKLWTLNFEQQNKLVTHINSSVSYKGDVSASGPFTFDRLFIYLFDRPDLIITPIATNNGYLIFSTADGLRKERFPEEIQQLLAETYDK